MRAGSMAVCCTPSLSQSPMNLSHVMVVSAFCIRHGSRLETLALSWSACESDCSDGMLLRRLLGRSSGTAGNPIRTPAGLLRYSARQAPRRNFLLLRSPYQSGRPSPTARAVCFQTRGLSEWRIIMTTFPRPSRWSSIWIICAPQRRFWSNSLLPSVEHSSTYLVHLVV